MTIITTTTSNRIDKHVVTFDNIATSTTVEKVSDYKDAIRSAVCWYQTIIDHKGLYFVVTQSGKGFVTKVAKGDSYGYNREGVELFDFEVAFVSATDIANSAFVALSAVRAERGRAFEQHVADGWYLRNVIDAPEEWLNAISKAQPQEAHALKELKELKMACAEAGRKATKSLRALEATREAVRFRTLDTKEKVTFSWKASSLGEDLFRADDRNGVSSVWTLRDICLRTDILDII